MAGHDAGLLVVAGGVAGELEDLGGEVLEDGGEVHRGTGTDAGGVLALLEVARDAADGELESRLGGAADAFLPVLPLPRPDMLYEVEDVSLCVHKSNGCDVRKPLLFEISGGIWQCVRERANHVAEFSCPVQSFPFLNSEISLDRATEFRDVIGSLPNTLPNSPGNFE